MVHNPGGDRNPGQGDNTQIIYPKMRGIFRAQNDRSFSMFFSSKVL